MVRTFQQFKENPQKKYHKFSIVNNLLATGGTAKCVSDLLLSVGKEIVGYSMVIELKDLKGRKNLVSPVRSQILM